MSTAAIFDPGPQPPRSAPDILIVRDLSVSLKLRGGPVPVVRDVSFDVAPGERVGIVGESGCGKTVTSLALLGLLPTQLARVTGQVVLDGRDINGMPERELRRIRGREIAMIFQEPMSALDPVFTIGEQIGEAIRTHFKSGAKQARERAIDILDSVGIPLPARRHDEYPHQLSGGMRQRAMIAIALACEPRLLVADEPTTALDVTIQAQILDKLVQLGEASGMAMLFITHDLGVVAETCHRVLTMYAGEVVEDGRTDDILKRPRHPYSSGLMRSLPKLSPRKSFLPSIPGRVPSAIDMPEGCRFQPRCLHAKPRCLLLQPSLAASRNHVVRCCRFNELTLPGTAS